MSITLIKAGITFNARGIFENVTFSVGSGDKVAIIGENGAGKSTLLRLLAAEEELSFGERITDGYVRTAFVHQDFPLDLVGENDTGEDVIRKRGGESLLRNTKRNMKSLGLDEKALKLPIRSLSGGQQKIVDLSMAFAEHSDFLFLDEPENHIDIFVRQALIIMMKEYRGGLAFVSHDQDLINSVTNRIVEIEDGIFTAYKGGYEFYLEEKQRQEAGKKRAWEAHQKKVQQLDRLIKRMHEWVQKNPDLGAQLSSRKTQLERLHKNAPVRPKVHKKMKVTLENSMEKASGKRVLLAESLSIQRGDKWLIRGLSTALFMGDKVALVGRNGTGKTSLLRAIMNETPFTGTLRLGEKIKVGYFSQDTVESLDPARTPLEALGEIVHEHEHSLRSMLARYLIDANHCNRSISTLSGGQKTRLRFCLLFASKYDLLLLDEPTNHLDPVTWGIVVQAMNEYEGSFILVSHDRMFIDQTAKQLWVVDNRQVELFGGTLSEYLEEEIVIEEPELE